MRIRDEARRTLDGVPLFFCTAVALLLFSTVSIPVNSPVHSAVGGFLAALPGVSVVGSVDGFTLTQTRYSDLNTVIPISFLILTGIVLRNGKRAIRLKIKALPTGFLLFALVAGVSACIFGEYVEAIKLAIYVLAVAAYFTLEKREKKQVLSALITMCLIAGVVNAVITIWQYGTMSNWSFTTTTIRLYRPDGIFGDSIISALSCNVCIAIAALRKEAMPGIVRMATIALCCIAGVVTGTRTFYYLAGVLGFYLLFAKTRGVPLTGKVILTIVAFVALAFLMSPTGQSLLGSLTVESSVSSRDIKQEIALEQFRDSPFFGIGTGQYANAEAALATDPKLGLHGTNPHNVYLQVLCENGLVGFAPLMASTIALLLLVIKQKNSAALILLLLYLAIAWSLGILYSVAFTSMFVALVCALVFAETVD